MNSNAAGFAYMLVMMVVSTVAGIIVFLTWSLDLPWLPLLASAVILAASLKFYSWLLDRSAKYAWEHVEQIGTELGA